MFEHKSYTWDILKKKKPSFGISFLPKVVPGISQDKSSETR
jgi:hypothetical protein